MSKRDLLSVALTATGVYVFLDGLFYIPWSLHFLMDFGRGDFPGRFPVAFVAAALAQTLFLLGGGWLLMTKSEWLVARLLRNDSSSGLGLRVGKRDLVEAAIKVIGVVLIAGGLVDSAEIAYQVVATGRIEAFGGGFGGLLRAFRVIAEARDWAGYRESRDGLGFGIVFGFDGRWLLSRMFDGDRKSNGGS